MLAAYETIPASLVVSDVFTHRSVLIAVAGNPGDRVPDRRCRSRRRAAPTGSRRRSARRPGSSATPPDVGARCARCRTRRPRSSRVVSPEPPVRATARSASTAPEYACPSRSCTAATGARSVIGAVPVHVPVVELRVLADLRRAGDRRGRGVRRAAHAGDGDRHRACSCAVRPPGSVTSSRAWKVPPFA